jgi:ferredoxin
MLTLNINGKDQELDVPADMPLLWVLRDVAHLTGTKFGCGMAQCGACTVHIDGAPLRSCITPATAVAHGQKILTIEGLSTDGSHPVQSLGRTRCGAVRLLSVRADHVCRRAAGENPQTDRQRYRSGALRQHSAAAAPIRESAQR